MIYVRDMACAMYPVAEGTGLSLGSKFSYVVGSLSIYYSVLYYKIV